MPWLGIALVVVPVVFFGFSLRGLGLAPVLVVVVLPTAWASRYASLSLGALALGIAAFCGSCSSGPGPALAAGRALAEPGYWSPPPAAAPGPPRRPTAPAQ